MKQRSSVKDNSNPIYTTINDWIQKEAISFSVDFSETFNSSIDKIIGSLDDSVELIGLGEALHGGEDILLIRNRLFQRLVEKHGYRAIAIESSFPRGRIVNEYINGCGPVSYEEIQDTGFSHGFGRLKANHELVEWMREYNADVSHRAKLRFYGFDSPTEMTSTDSPRQVLYFVLDYLTSIDMHSAKDHRERIDLLLGQDADWDDPAAMMDHTKSIGLSPAANELRIETEDLINELQIRRPELVAKSNKSQYLEAVHYAKVARQLLNYHATLAKKSEPAKRIIEGLGLRDMIMAENLEYIVSHERGWGKVMAFAHNSHLQRGKAQWQLGTDLLVWWPAGSHLNEIFGSHYAVIGSAVGISKTNGIFQPEHGTLESLLTNFSKPALFIPTYKGQVLPASEIEALPTRSDSMKNPTYFALTSQSFINFDWLLFLASTAYSRGGPQLQ
ncbi:erythromycin esterase family protein [uncultured Methanomethylovorans sp.]|uniref:erythromycin esterase family protein n=1 Tax=uncultured Methanomethylovorans sp. TaxID=183759 RepID=UPI002AA963D8|nr:erythromycin esterase family protein [uncultured Methanomethylovorans sp.]